METSLHGPVVSMFIDNIKIMTPKESGIIQCVKLEPPAAFLIVDMRSISFYLDLKIE